MSFGLAILWIIFAIIATWLYFLTQIDLSNYHPPTSIKIDGATNAKVSPPINLSLFSNGIMNIEDVSELTFYRKNGTCRKAKVKGKRLAYGGGGIVIDGVSLDETNLPGE